jgi:phytoene dehydrogenase-like protein
VTPRVIVIGAGTNGLVAAFYLARAGLRPLVLERREVVGGAAVTSEIAPGVRVPVLTHAVGPFRADIASDMDLSAHGVRWICPEVASFTPTLDGRALVLARDAWKASAALERWSERDAAHYPDFVKTVAAISGLVADLAVDPPPSLESPTATELWGLLKTGRRFRALGRERAYLALRWAPMAIADLLDDWFETDVLQATLATRGVFASNLGPRSAGTAALLLVEASRQIEAPLAPVFVAGGPGALTVAIAMAASQAGAEIRQNVDVARIEATEAGVHRVVLATGEEIAASLVVSAVDPRRTLLGFIDPVWLEPTVLERLRHYRVHGTVAKVNLVLDRLPTFTAARDLPPQVPIEAALAGRVLIAPSIDTIEQAFDASKYGAWSPRPWLECTVPTLSDPSLAPAGTHVLSVYAQYAPYALRGATWEAERDAFGRAVIDTLAEYAPDLPDHIRAVHTITPFDLERTYGMTGGHIHHGEMSLDQLFVMRPLLGWARHRTPIRGLYLSGAGTHPGGGITGANGLNAAKAVLQDLSRDSGQ